MGLNRNKLYSLLAVACLAGYIWLFSNYSAPISTEGSTLEVCLIKHITNIPCPSCGATRSAVSLLKGSYIESLYWNPIGILLIIILAVTPVWLLYDVTTKRSTLLQFYFKTESFFRRKRIALPAIVLVMGNWIWNIYKGL